MECVSSPYTPVILQPESGQDWTQQHILGDRFRLGHTKQSGPVPIAGHNGVITKQWAARQSTGRRARLHIPGTQSQGGRVGKPVYTLKTPIRINTKSSREWEELLHSSLATLQGAYTSMEAPPPQQSQTLAERMPKSPLTGLDRAEMASRALQAAAGCAMCPVDDNDDRSSLSATEDSYGSDDTPLTPDTVRTAEDMNIDPRLFS